MWLAAALLTITLSAAAAGVDELVLHNSSALVAENQHLRAEVRLLRQLLAAAAGSGADSGGVLPRQADVTPAPSTQRRTLQDLLPPRSSPFRKYLFLNESIFDGAPRHARTTFNPPTNVGAVIKPDQPWEAGIYPFSQVIQFGSEIRVYYHCQGDTPSGTFLVAMLCLAISTDGRSFVKPDLGAVPFNGSKHNNIVMCPVMNGVSCDVGAQKSGWYPPGPVWLDPRPGVPPDELWKSTGGNGNLVISADGKHFRRTDRSVMQQPDWNWWAMIYDENALPSDGSNCDILGTGTPGRFVAYGRSDDPGNAQLPGHPKVCGDLAGMRAVTRQQSIDGNHTECTGSKLVFPAWDNTDPQPLLNGAPLTWSDTKDASCTGASEAQRIAASKDGRSPWNDVYYAFPVKYGADFLFYIPILRHFQYGAISARNPTGAQLGPPFNTGGDGLVEPRLGFSEDGINISYTQAENSRDPWARLGINTCPAAQRGDPGEWGMGWCNPVGNETSLTSSDTSVIWPAAGMALAPDEQSVLSFAATAPFTHGGLSISPSLPCPNRTACSGVHQRTQVEMLKQRLDGFVSVDADYLFDNDTSMMPGFTTRVVAVPNVTSCEAPATELQLRMNLQTSVVGFVAVELVEPSGVVLPGFAQSDADIIVGNFLERPATWRGGNATINAIAGRSVQLRVLFAAAKVFSFQFVCV